LAGSGIGGVEPSGSATIQLISEVDLRETGCEDGRLMELAQDRVQWRALVLAVLNLRVLLPESLRVSGALFDLEIEGCTLCRNVR
jgi:hypothetical protein